MSCGGLKEEGVREGVVVGRGMVGFKDVGGRGVLDRLGWTIREEGWEERKRRM